MNVCHGFAYVLKYLGNLSFYSPCWAHHKFLEAHWIDINTFIIRSVASEGWVPEFPLSLSDSLTSLLFWVKIESILSNTKNCQQSLLCLASSLQGPCGDCFSQVKSESQHHRCQGSV